MTTRTLEQIIPSQATSDGAGVKLRRSLGQSPDLRHDPFLLLDEFGTDKPEDYLAGFPEHPHRGFETVTYMLDGHMRHGDHLGHSGDLKAGGVQWMTAGRGIVHSEMPQQAEGRMRGFQLWVNLPAAEKMKAAGYRDLQPEDIPVVSLPRGGKVKVIAGRFTHAEQETAGPIRGLTTDPTYLDVELPAGGQISQPVPADYSAFVYAYEGTLEVGAENARKTLPAQAAGLLSSGERIEVAAGREGARFILLAGRPIGEPIVQYGPFVMNTPEEINQAVRDFQTGALTAY
ncbi:MAG: pirin family protein [Gammaproteobacteria bacterium]|nr:pirin family protein [Gammaproteobacteria bacterium]